MVIAVPLLSDECNGNPLLTEEFWNAVLPERSGALAFSLENEEEKGVLGGRVGKS